MGNEVQFSDWRAALLCRDVCRNLGKVDRQVTAVVEDTKWLMAVKVTL